MNIHQNHKPGIQTKSDMSDYSEYDNYGDLPLWSRPRPLGVPIESLLPDPKKFDTLQAAQDDFKVQMVTPRGGSCHCCGRYGKIYKRSLLRAMVNALIVLYNNKTDEYTHYRDKQITDTLPSRDFGTLVHWGLTEAQKGKKSDGNPKRGYYRITEKGRKFVQGRLSVPKHVYLYDNEMVYVHDEETVTIRDVMGKDFNYDELMSS